MRKLANKTYVKLADWSSFECRNVGFKTFELTFELTLEVDSQEMIRGWCHFKLAEKACCKLEDGSLFRVSTQKLCKTNNFNNYVHLKTYYL